MKNKLLLSLLGLVLVFNLSAQTSLSGKVMDHETGEPIMFGNVKAFQGGVLKNATQTDFYGNYNLSPIDPGSYDIEVSYVAYAPERIEGVVILEGQNNSLNIFMTSGVELDEVIIMSYSVPLIDRDNTQKGGTVTSDQMTRLPSKSVNGIVANVAGTSSAGDGDLVAINGSRSDATVYCIDGVRVSGNTEVPPPPPPPASPSPPLSIPPVAPEPTTGEEYNGLPENEFIYPLEEAVSTFSIDVDHASYANVRRFITNGQLPPPEAVRVEEMINYFDYDYVQPVWPEPFSVYTETGPCPWNPEAKLLHIGLQGIDVDFEQAPPNNLVFLVDVSGSMSSPNKLPLVQEALAILVKKLRAEDKVSIVSYAGASGLVLEPTSGADTKTILEAINRMQSGGSTAGGAGIELAYEVALEQFLPSGNNRVILATDGDFNVGVSSEQALEELIVSKREDGIFLTVLGFGYGNYKDNKLEILADKGNGNYAYIDQGNEAKKVFVQEITGTLLAIAKDVKIQVEFDPELVESYRLVGYENRMLTKEDFEDDTKDAGELGSGHTVTAIYELILKTGAEGKDLAELRLRYKRPQESVSALLTQPISLNIQGLEACSDGFRFSTAVAAFGMLLRHSKYRGYLTAQDIIDLGEGAQAADSFGYRAEFIELVRQADEMSLFGLR